MSNSFDNAEQTLPSGTVTFLFTDIEGSTVLAQNYPKEMPALLKRHNTILRDAIESNHGYVFRIAGDAFCAAFPTPGDGFQAALTAQRALQHEPWKPTPVLVRMGINTGEARLSAGQDRSDAYDGYLTLTRAQRVMSAAHGGQILVSNTTAELLRDVMPREVALRDMGAHKLKGLRNAEALWQVVAPDLRQDFAPLQTLEMAPSNLPGALNRFVGRARELQEVKTRLGQTRLLTLLGPGGTGKTRLALQAARELLPDFEDRVYFVDLATSRDSDAVLAAIARTLGVRETSDKSLQQELAKEIGQTKMLLLLDNFEQVTIAGATMAELLRDCPELKMLVTSREILHVRGETVFPVPPLALPQTVYSKFSAQELAQSEAVQLFVERAHAVNPDFELTDANAPVVAEICARLDGLPLAIELATARLNVFTPAALLERLGNRLKLLRGGARDLPERHQTLRDTIDWSYDLLDANEQKLFQMLSVFTGASLDAVEQVAEGIPVFSDTDIFEAVSSLVDKSLVRQVDAGGAGRLRMLETIREFGAACLEENRDLHPLVCRVHAAYYAAFTAKQWEQLRGTGRDRALDELTVELANIQTAWRYWTGEHNLEQMGKFTDSLWMLYDARGWYHAAVDMTSELLEVLSTTTPTPERANQQILLQMSLARALLAMQGFTEEVEQAYERALDLCTNAGEIPEAYPVLRGLGAFYLQRGDNAKSFEMGQRLLALAERLDDDDIRAEAHLVLGENIGSLNEPTRGLEHLEQALTLYDHKRQRVQRMRGGANPAVLIRTVSTMFLWVLGYPERALERSRQSIALAHELRHPFSLCYALYHDAFVRLWSGDLQGTQVQTQLVMDLAAEHGFQIWSAAALCVRGTALASTGAIEQGLAAIETGLTNYRELKTPPVFLPLMLHLQARSYHAAGRSAEALAILDEGIAISATSPAMTIAPDFMDLRGQLLLAIDPGNTDEAAGTFEAGLQMSQQMNTKMFALRNATRLARVRQGQGRTAEARTVLSSAYGKMTEGFDMLDLVQARTLLQELEQAQ